jgi:membrane fusion protein (multidrug efflux system)
MCYAISKILKMNKFISVIFLSGLVIGACNRGQQAPDVSGQQGGKPGGAPGGNPAPRMAVPGAKGMPSEFPVLTVAFSTVTVHQDFPATIRGQRVVEIRPMVNGYIQDIKVNEGDRVKKGQLLFRISNPVLDEAVNAAKARIISATADVNTAALEVEKVKPLVEKDIVSSYRLKSAELTLQTRQASLEEAKAALKNAETNLAYTFVRSPLDGIIGTIPYKSGALVGSSSLEPLTTLSDITEVFAYFSWNEKQVLDLMAGASGNEIENRIRNLPQATLVLSNSTEYPLKGRIEMASGLISTETGAATFKAVFKNPDGILRSGSSALVRIPKVYNNVIVVPQSATYELQDKRFIYVVGSENKVASKEIAYIPTDDGKSFIVTDGLKQGDRIVTQGILSLREGSTIVPSEAQMPGATDSN